MSEQPLHRQSRRFARPNLGTAPMPLAPTAYNGWREYVETHGIPHVGKLCHVLAKFGGELKAAARQVNDFEPGKDLAGFPWVTPIVGSGCLSLPDEPQRQHLLALPGRLALALSDVEVNGAADVASIVSGFASSMLEQRVQELSGQHFPLADGEIGPTVDETVVARTLLAAALVRRAWHEGVAMSTAIVRLRDELPLTADERAEDIRVGYLEPAARSLEAACDLLKATPDSELQPMLKVISRLASRVDNLVKGEAPRLNGHDVELLLEVAWLMLITAPGLYPGWRDLMTETALQSSLLRHALETDRPLDVRHPTIQTIDEANDLAASVATLHGATQRSWRDRLAGAASLRIDFYDAVADLLIAQSSYGDDMAPIPAAFVTSMDVELEMSLWQAGQRFTVLVPYHFLYAPSGSEHRAMLFWLAAQVDPGSARMGDTFDLANADLKWRVAPPSVVRNVDSIVVVRLVGSPLMPAASAKASQFHDTKGDLIKGTNLLARLTERAASATGGSSVDQFIAEFDDRDLSPALMLDEYSGMHQMAAVVQGTLPANLVTLEPEWFYRFWLGVGVQLDDVLVRLLVASHIDTHSGRRGLLEHHGVMVNRYVSRSDADPLAWQGFDAVQSRFDHVTDDLNHYADHMRFRASDNPKPRDPEHSFANRGQCHVVREQSA